MSRVLEDVAVIAALVWMALLLLDIAVKLYHLK